ncbi:hypothetical protein ACFODO_19440 [Acinetobacter sichuanensis]|uniref:Uncharacterized protein n=1 Tax=Acinetobacter sichuanensis TaxID=2136183 RepID=A0A371YIK3_9GAMM|nr:hypothetical protein [Acinetobacter sichuanensis]MDQ9022785.1 hypothetical protein [Acinetobacter sichuanensis]RFC81309.1 hypothetical protein C9E89_022560 [Acinetobacter sichuanensis]
MAAYSITFDLNKVESLNDLEKVINTISKHTIQPAPSQYIISSTLIAGAIKDRLEPFFKQGSPLLVIKIDINDYASLHIDNRIMDALSPIYF